MLPGNIDRFWTVQIETDIFENRVRVNLTARIAQSKPEQIQQLLLYPEGS
jgi:hypothetical protein